MDRGTANQPAEDRLLLLVGKNRQARADGGNAPATRWTCSSEWMTPLIFSWISTSRASAVSSSGEILAISFFRAHRSTGESIISINWFAGYAARRPRS